MGGRLPVNVGHGVDTLVLQIPDQHAAVMLTPADAERLGMDLIRQAQHARTALESPHDDPPPSSPPVTPDQLTSGTRDLGKLLGKPRRVQVWLHHTDPITTPPWVDGELIGYYDHPSLLIQTPDGRQHAVSSQLQRRVVEEPAPPQFVGEARIAYVPHIPYPDELGGEIERALRGDV